MRTEEKYYGTNDPDGVRRKMVEEQESEDWKMRRSMESKMCRHYPGMKPDIHPCISRALSGRHILFLGTTGSGKTYAASYMARFLDAFIFINTQEEREASLVCDVRLDDPSEVQEAFEEGYRKIEFIPSMDRDEAREEVQTIREGLFEIGSEMKAQSNELEIPTWISVFLDEAQVYAPLMTHKDAENFWTRGRGYGIRGIALTRQPQELSKEIVNNVEFELIFRLGDYAMPYFTRFKIPIEHHLEWIDREHHFLLYDKRGLYRCLPVP